MGYAFHGIIAGMDKCRSQKQVLCGIAANGKLGRQQQARAIGVGLLCGGDDFLRIAVQITDDEITLRNAQFESHEPELFC